jgi:hypothetical protein
MARELCEKCGYPYPEYIIKMSGPGVGSSTAFRQGYKPIIYICFEDVNMIRFDDETITIAFIHELAHVLSPGEGHDENFMIVERNLTNAAIDMDYIDDDSQIDVRYPCK